MTLKTADGYVRVSSKVAGRGGESFISPREQRAAIEEWARRSRVEIVEWHDDLDQSGGTLERPGFQRALERCRAGASGGIVAAKLDRLTRSVVGLGTLLGDAAEHGYNVVAIDLGLDLQSPNGELVANLFGSVAQWERRRRAEDWDVARRSAIERGIVNGRAPFGYRKASDRRLLIVEHEAAIVREVFERRAAGEAVSTIARRLGWSQSTTRQRLADEAYLGVARAGGHRNENAHPAIVTRELFDAVKITLAATRPTGETTADRLLVGIARCAGCGRTLKVVRRRRQDASRVAAYYCKNAASDACQERAFVRADELDAYIAQWFEAALASEPRFVEAVEAAAELEDARAEVTAAELELTAFVTAASALDAVLFQQGVDARQRRLDAARQRVAVLAAQSRAVPVGGSVSEVWDQLEPIERRTVLAGYLASVIVRRGASADLAGSVDVVWADGTAAGAIADFEERALVAAA
jgi:DNA invertase Pin-like site-specific DNA recombinase